MIEDLWLVRSRQESSSTLVVYITPQARQMSAGLTGVLPATRHFPADR